MNLLEVLADDTTILPYRKELREIAGGVAATIFLGQLLYWVKRKGNGFYKFKTPSENNPYYKKGDSWCEELGFSVDELDGAIKKLKAANLLDKKTLPDRRTIWTLNLELLSDKLSKLKATTEFTQMGKPELRNRENPSYVNGNFPVTKTGKEQLPYNTEITTEITTETTSESSSLSLANARTREATSTDNFSQSDNFSPPVQEPAKKFQKPTIEQIKAYCLEAGKNIDAEAFFDFYEAKGWVVGRAPMKDWKAAVRNWAKNESQFLRRKVNEKGEEVGSMGLPLSQVSEAGQWSMKNMAELAEYYKAQGR